MFPTVAKSRTWVSAVTGCAVIVKVAEVWPAGIVRVAGDTVNPAGGASRCTVVGTSGAPVRVMVPCAVWPLAMVAGTVNFQGPA